MFGWCVGLEFFFGVKKIGEFGEKRLGNELVDFEGFVCFDKFCFKFFCYLMVILLCLNFDLVVGY